jgi:hypothetical protein
MANNRNPQQPQPPQAQPMTRTSSQPIGAPNTRIEIVSAEQPPANYQARVAFRDADGYLRDSYGNIVDEEGVNQRAGEAGSQQMRMSSSTSGGGTSSAASLAQQRATLPQQREGRTEDPTTLESEGA